MTVSRDDVLTAARTAAAFARPSESLLELRAAHPDLFVLLGEGLPFSPTPLPGGLPVHLGDRLVGGLGVSGATPDQDVELATAALSALARPEGGPPANVPPDGTGA